LPLHGSFSRRAVVTLVTNDFLADKLRRRGAKTAIVRDVPVCFAQPNPIALKGSVKMTFISTFTRDEPIDAFLEAASQVSDVQFYITGRLRDANPEVLKRAPINVTFTDFLSDSDYVGLLLASDAVICLTTEDHTMQRGAYEAVYLGRPVITSNFPLLRQSFPIGAVYVRDIADDIATGIREMKKNIGKYQSEVEQLQVRKLDNWKRVEQELETMLAASTGSATTSAASAS